MKKISEAPRIYLKTFDWTVDKFEECVYRKSFIHGGEHRLLCKAQSP